MASTLRSSTVRGRASSSTEVSTQMAAQAAVSDRLGVPGLPTLISSDPTSGVGFPTAADKVPLEWDTTYLLEDDLRMVDTASPRTVHRARGRGVTRLLR
jgi:hypothetical protein